MLKDEAVHLFSDWSDATDRMDAKRVCTHLWVFLAYVGMSSWFIHTMVKLLLIRTEVDEMVSVLAEADST